MITKTLKKYVLSRIIPARAVIYSNGNTISTEITEGTTFQSYVFSGVVVGEFKNVGADIPNKRSIIQKKGSYLIECTFCSRIDTVGVNLETCVLVNDIEVPNLHIKRYFIGASYLSAATISGLANLNKGDTVSIGVKHDHSGSINIITEYSSLIILKV